MKNKSLAYVLLGSVVLYFLSLTPLYFLSQDTSAYNEYVTSSSSLLFLFISYLFLGLALVFSIWSTIRLYNLGSKKIAYVVTALLLLILIAIPFALFLGQIILGLFVLTAVALATRLLRLPQDILIPAAMLASENSESKIKKPLYFCGGLIFYFLVFLFVVYVMPVGLGSVSRGLRQDYLQFFAFLIFILCVVISFVNYKLLNQQSDFVRFAIFIPLAFSLFAVSAFLFLGSLFVNCC